MAEATTASPGFHLPKWFLPLVIGMVTIVAALFTWRAGQLGSSAAFYDRQSVGQTITAQEQDEEAKLGATSHAVAYVRYLADYGEALALDGLADEIGAQGADTFAQDFRDDAERLRLTATAQATAAGVFGRQTAIEQLAASPTEPLPFDLEQQIARLQAEAQSGIGSPGVVDPQAWADRADDTRARVRGLRLAAMLLLTAVVAFTIAQLSDRRPTRLIGAGLGSLMFLVVTAVAVTSVY